MGPEGKRELLHKGAKFDFERLTLAGPGGREVVREFVRHPGAVVVLPLLSEGSPGWRGAGEAPRDLRVVTIRNFRPALGREVHELPAGTLEPPEPPRACAARELIEETGYEAEAVERLGTFYTTPGMTDERMHAFAAFGLREVGQDLQEDERIRVELVTPGALWGLVASGSFDDAKSMLGCFLARERGWLPGPDWC